MNFTKPKNDGPKTNLTPDIYNAVCVGVWDLGLQAPSGAFAGGRPSYKVMLAWETQSGELVTKEYTRQIDEWSDRKTGAKKQTKLKEHLESWFAPHKINDPANFDARKLLGQHCRLVISLSAGGYPRVDSVTRPDPNAINWTPTRQPMYYEIGDEIPAGTEGWIVSRIETRIKEGEEPQQHPDEAPQAPKSGAVPF